MTDDALLSTTLLSTARSWLFVPGDRPERFDKAAASGADMVICDLEDSVTSNAKEIARSAVAQWLRSGGSAAVRVNPVDTPWHEDDIAALTGAPGLRAIVLPKSEEPSEVADVGHAAGVPIIALVETALGILRAADIAAMPAVLRLAFGSLDYALDVNADAEDEQALLLARTSVVMCSRAVGAPGPIDGVTMALDDSQRLLADTRRSRSLGFTAKLCVHPRQVPAIHQGFAPTDAQVAWAKDILAVAAASSVGAARTSTGMLVDAPVIARANALLAGVRPEGSAG